jgi:hypothetical protein
MLRSKPRTCTNVSGSNVLATVAFKGRLRMQSNVASSKLLPWRLINHQESCR